MVQPSDMNEKAWIEDLVRRAGAEMRAAFAKTSESGYTLKGAQDYLTQTDGQIEHMVRHAVSEAFPSDGFLGEETGGAPTSAGRLWIVDPIDGTANFARGIPHFCISLGLLQDGIPVLGAIYDPMHDELFLAAKGEGAYLNGERIKVSNVDSLSLACVEVGWNNRRTPEDFVDLAGKVVRAGAAFRRAGSGALGLAYVAAGRSDAYVELHINAWDVAAGLLLVTEAGGRVNDFWAADALRQGNCVLACNAALAPAASAMTGISLMSL
jgi:myo-inositol-1(or 4)-monophosphatase